MYPLSASFQEHVRSHWGQVFLKTVCGALFIFAFWLWVCVFDVAGSVLRWRKCCISSPSNIRVYGPCSYVRALWTLSMWKTTRTGMMVPLARVPTNPVTRSFGSGNDYGKKSKPDFEMRCSCSCTPTHACHACCIFAFKHTILCHAILFAHTVYNQDIHVVGANWRLLSKCLVRRVGRGFRCFGAASELGLDGLVHCLPLHLFGYLAPA